MHAIGWGGGGGGGGEGAIKFTVDRVLNFARI